MTSRCAAVSLALLAASASAAPVLGGDEPLSTTPLTGGESPSELGAAASTTSHRVLDRSLNPAAITGSKALDLLLELQIRPAKEARPIGARPSAAAASVAAAELAALRAKAAQRPPAQQDEQDASAQAAPPRLADRPFERLGTLHGDVRVEQAEPLSRREWVGQVGGAGGPAGYGAKGESSKTDAGDDNLVRQALREVGRFLEENRLLLLGGAGLVVALGAALKAYSRRP